MCGIISFNGNKVITTGGGGMILTQNEKLATNARCLSPQAKDDRVQYIHNEITVYINNCNICGVIKPGFDYDNLCLNDIVIGMKNNKWYIFNDSNISLINSDNELENLIQNSYILNYKK